MTDNHLIFDIGMYNGDDTAYYLACGHTVVAVEADPTWILKAQARFGDPIQMGKLQIIPGAISDTVGTTAFWIDQAQDGVNSSLLSDSPRNRGQRIEIRVDTLTLADLIMQYGTPYYINLDIEGAELLALSSLLGERVPHYISAEINNEALFELLDQFGYRAFQVIDQAYMYQQKIDINGKAWQFTHDSSGPFGEQLLSDAWLPLEEAQKSYHELTAAHSDGWFDLHGRL